MKIIKPDQACVLTINGDSSSIELALYQKANRWSEGFMEVDRIGLPNTNLTFTRPGIGRTAAASPPPRRCTVFSAPRGEQKGLNHENEHTHSGIAA